MCPGFVSSDMFGKSESFISRYVYYYLAPILAKVSVLLAFGYVWLFTFFFFFPANFFFKENSLSSLQIQWNLELENVVMKLSKKFEENNLVL